MTITPSTFLRYLFSQPQNYEQSLVHILKMGECRQRMCAKNNWATALAARCSMPLIVSTDTVAVLAAALDIVNVTNPVPVLACSSYSVPKIHTIPPPTLSSQTVKDVSRERFDVNRVPTKPSDCWCKIRASLLHAALDYHSDSAKNSELGANNGDGGVLMDAESISRATGREDGLGSLDSSTLLSDTAVGEEAAASGDAAAGKEVSPGGNGIGGEGKAGKGKVWGVGNECKGGMKGNRRQSKSGLEMYVDQCAWRVLHAASRTASGGDCFFVVQVNSDFLCTYAHHGRVHPCLCQSWPCLGMYCRRPPSGPTC